MGCVIEEVSTTHIKGDSIYEDLSISKLELKDILLKELMQTIILK